MTSPVSRTWKRIAFFSALIGGSGVLLARYAVVAVVWFVQPSTNAAILDTKASKESVVQLRADVVKVTDKFDTIKDDIAAINKGQGELNGKVDTMLLMMEKKAQP